MIPKQMEPLPTWSVKLSDSRTTTLAKCLRENHKLYVPLRDPHLIFHNHMPHILGSSYYLGASSDKLEEIFKHEGSGLRPTDTVPTQEPITQSNWRDHLTSKAHTLMYTKFFDDQGDWKQVLQEYLYSSSSPIINGMCGGLGHPFIHLAYAYEFDCPEVASEALSLGCTEYDYIHKYLDNPPPDTSTYKSNNVEEILSKVHNDKRFDGFDLPGYTNTFIIHENHEEALLEHWNAFVLEDFDSQFEAIYDLAVRISVETTDASNGYDFFLIHLLTTAHALRVILPYAPPEFYARMLRQFVLWMLVIYIAQLRRPIHKGSIESVVLEGQDWKWAQEKALTGPASLDAHYVKVIRSLKVGSELWGEKNDWYLKAAVKFISEFDQWTGFGRGVE